MTRKARSAYLKPKTILIRKAKGSKTKTILPTTDSLMKKWVLLGRKTGSNKMRMLAFSTKTITPMPIVMKEEKMTNQILSVIIFPKQGMETGTIGHHNKTTHTGKKCKASKKSKTNCSINSAAKTTELKGQILNWIELQIHWFSMLRLSMQKRTNRKLKPKETV